MATGITERNQIKIELAAKGYSLKYIDEWQPKTRLYRHKPAYNVDGNMTEDVGTFVENVPGNPEYVARKAKIGLFQWPPSDGCVCQWCQESFKAPKDQKQETDGEEKNTSPSKLGPHYKG